MMTDDEVHTYRDNLRKCSDKVLDESYRDLRETLMYGMCIDEARIRERIRMMLRLVEAEQERRKCPRLTTGEKQTLAFFVTCQNPAETLRTFERDPQVSGPLIRAMRLVMEIL